MRKPARAQAPSPSVPSLRALEFYRRLSRKLKRPAASSSSVSNDRREVETGGKRELPKEEPEEKGSNVRVKKEALVAVKIKREPD